MFPRIATRPSVIASLGFLVCTSFVAASLFAAPPDKPDNSVFFIQMTDPQLFGVFGGKRTVDKGLDDEETLFTRAIDHANRLKPDFVVITGDLVQNQGKKPEEVDAFKRITKKLDSGIPLYLVSGNHDVTADPASLKWYRETFGKDFYAFDVGDCRFIVLNTQIMRSDDQTSGEAGRQLAWLKEQLAEASRLGKTIVIFTHQSIILKSDDEPTTYFSLPPKPRRLYLDLFSKHNVAAVFSGHYHRNAKAAHGGVDYVTTSAVCMPLGNDPPGMRLVRVRDGKVEHKYYSLDEVPATP